jgi:RHS repeat-associated protein
VRYNAGQVSTGMTQNWTRAVDYSYTPDGLNRSQMMDNGQATSYTPNGMNQYVGVNGAASLYDQNFNLYTLNGWRYDYNADKQLLLTTNGASTGTFLYDGLGRCVRRAINNVPTIITYDGWKPTVEWDASGNLSALNVYGPGADEILYRYIAATNQRLRYHHDIHGNVTALLDWGGGTVLERYTYDAFGQPTILSAGGTQLSTSAVGNRFMFQGREYLSELGLYDYRHRMYHPGLGRFLQTDPLGFGGGDANLFRYCGNDPVNGSDPSGLQWATTPTVRVDGGGVDGWQTVDFPGELAFLSEGRGFHPSPGRTYSGQLHSVGPDGKINRHPNGTSIGQHPSGPGQVTTDPVIAVLFPAEPGQDVLTGLQLSWWPSWLTLPHYAHAVDPETAAWTDKGKWPTLIVAGAMFLPAAVEFVAPEGAIALGQSLEALPYAARLNAARVLVGAQALTIGITTAAYKPIDDKVLQALEEEMVLWEFWRP